MDDDEEVDLRLTRRHLKALASTAETRGTQPTSMIHDPEALAAAFGRIIRALIDKKGGP